MKLCCPCDELKHPAKPDIPAGLATLPRQPAGFPEYRLAMLRDIPNYASLAQWRAREGEDLGIMLLDMWAYVLDILGFYDERIANESYLRTAILRSSLRKLIGLIGYQPRPALAASVVLAAIADGNRLVKLPPRTGFRSDAFDGEPPQVFETEIEHTIHPLKNEWTLAPLRERFPGKDILFDPETASLAQGQLVLFRWAAAKTVQLRAGRVSHIETIDARDGASYLKVEIVDRSPDLDPAVELAVVEVLSPKLSASVSPFASTPVRHRSHITLDALHTQLAEQDAVVIQRGRKVHAATITAVKSERVAIIARTPQAAGTAKENPMLAFEGSVAVDPLRSTTDVPLLPATSITVSPELPEDWDVDPTRLVVHFDMAPAGRLTRVAKTHLNAGDFAPPGIALESVVETLPQGVAAPSELLLLDAHDNGRLANGSVDIDPTGNGNIHLTDAAPFDPPLRTPVTVFGNPVRATRGESVFNEVLGSGDASQAFQSFTLGNNPLTYINDPSAPGGRRSTLAVRVNGLRWRQVPSFFGVGPEGEVYIVRQNDDGESLIVFGDGINGARLPTGVDNVTATYRFGAGAAKPPAGTIGQLARPAQGLRRVVNPVAAGGGADADQSKDMRRNAPNSALILGRAVSVQDFEALAREFGGVINAHVEWAWDETAQRAVVKVWFISDGGRITKDLERFLIGQSDPNTPLIAEEAQAIVSDLVIDIAIDPRFNPQTVNEKVRLALTNAETGILALEHIPIGRPLFRSRVFEAVLSVEGTRSVRALTMDGQPAPFAISVGQGRYRNFLDGLAVSGSAARNTLSNR